MGTGKAVWISVRLRVKAITSTRVRSRRARTKFETTAKDKRQYIFLRYYAWKVDGMVEARFFPVGDVRCSLQRSLCAFSLEPHLRAFSST